VATKIDQRRWRDAYLAEIERAGRETGDRILQSVFLGGGTPSLMDPDLVAAIIEKVRATWPMSNDPEITIEANPGSVETGRLAAYRDGGVNRVSIGVQALNDTALRQLGRMHTAAEAIRAVEIAQVTFARVNFDLIYARQGQDAQSWKEELTKALSLASGHLSLYQLTIEEGTVFHDRNLRGLLRGLPDEDHSADLFAMTQDITAEAGLPAYEVSNHARPGEESRHNLTYWRGGDYVGIGPGAHGRLTFEHARYTTECPKEPLFWLQSVESGRSGELPRQRLSAADQASEYVLMGLRLHDGIWLDRLQPEQRGMLNSSKALDLVDQGLIVLDERRLRATKAGIPVLNHILRTLLSD